MKRKIIFCLIETAEISSDSDTSISSNVSELSNSSTEEECNWTDEEDALYFPLIKYLTSGVKRAKVDNYLAIVESWTDSEFKKHLRLSRRTVYQLIGKRNTFILIIYLIKEKIYK